MTRGFARVGVVGREGHDLTCWAGGSGDLWSWNVTNPCAVYTLL
jgi:hypothetical protein